MTDETTTTATEEKPAMVFMTRDPNKGGLGVSKMLVPADEVPLFEKAGWMKSEQ